MTAAPPEQLLRSGGAQVHASESVMPFRGLGVGLDAALLLRLAASPPLPRRWSAALFGRDVERIRAQLLPVRSREVLAAVFAQEAHHSTAPRRSRALETSPLRVAYAIRWLELGDGLERPAWHDWLIGHLPADGRGEDPAQSRSGASA